jgi:5'-3' exoribonuclease 1
VRRSASLPQNSSALFLGEQHYGRVAKISNWVGAAKKGTSSKAQVKVEATNAVSGLDQAGRKLADRAEKDKYKSALVVGSIVGLSPLILSRIVSVVTIDTPSGERYNVGLGLKFARRGLQIPGYARRVQVHFADTGRTSDQWQYSDRATALLRLFKETYPDFFRGLAADPKADNWELEQVFVQDDNSALEGPEALARLESMVAWLQSSGIFELPLMPCDSSALNDCSEIETVARRANYENVTASNRSVDVDESFLLQPLRHPLQFETRSFLLGHRVAHVRDGGSIPFGANGTIVSISKGKAEVMMDHPFLLGTTLNGKCKDPRGASVSMKWLLNLSTKELFVAKKRAVVGAADSGVINTTGVSGKKNATSSTANPFQPLAGAVFAGGEWKNV